MTNKLDIKDVLYHIDKKDYDWFSTLSGDEQDSFNPFVVMQFLNGGNSDNLILTNFVLNKNFSGKSKNKELFYRLCCVVGMGSKQYHPYTKPPKGNKRVSTNFVRLISNYLSETLTEEEALLFINKNKKLYNLDFWVMIAEGDDWSKEDISKLETELKPVFNQ